MLLDHANQTFDQCIKCTVCTAYCPVAKANPAYPGPKQAGPDGERLRIKSPELFDSALKYCTNCKRCEVACPSGCASATSSPRPSTSTAASNRGSASSCSPTPI